MARWLLILRTVIWLKPIQIWWRLYLKIWRPRPKTIRGVRIVPPERPWQALARAPSMTGPSTFRFLNREEDLPGPKDWTRPDLPMLWLYNLHYFDDLTADDAAARTAWHRALIQRWIAQHPAPTKPGWDPYPTSLRIVNWAKWALAGHSLDAVAEASLGTQADWLSRRLEYHLLGNHLFANGKALVFAGCVCDGPEAEIWLKKGLKILSEQIPEQILEDGAHFERSVMYHAILAADMLDLCQLAMTYPQKLQAHAALWQRKTAAMVGWLRTFCHPDGGIAFFNDGAFGIAPAPAALFDHAAALGVADPPPPAQGVSHAHHAGYARLAAGPAVLFCDVAPIGPGYLPGHAHADTLSCELSLFGQRLFVNGGTSVYDADPSRRAFERSTAAHNSVEVDGRNSSEVWASFRAARRATASVDRVSDEGPLCLAAHHNGYARIHGGPLHHRHWRLDADSLTITDRLDGPFETAIARYRLHPDVEA
ncbi:MAG: alginate lyase family protein, partial [Pseudomonadota bacterium]